MKIKTKYRLMYFSVVIALIPIGIILYLFNKLFEWYGELLSEYKFWCAKKNRVIIQSENGIWIYNPKYSEEEKECK